MTLAPRAALALLVALAAGPAPAAPPNIILILSDDQGFPDYGFMGSKIARTPNLDRMAAQSLLYTRGYVMPVCSPSLACLLTGQLPHVHGVTGNDLSGQPPAAGRGPLTRQLLRQPLLLPKSLAAAGYRSFQTGKLWNVTAQEVGLNSACCRRMDFKKRKIHKMNSFYAPERERVLAAAGPAL